MTSVALKLKVYSFAECHLLGRFLEVIKKDANQAATTYRSNCEFGRHGPSCYSLGQLYHSDVGDHAKAFEYNRKGCELGHTKSCLDAGLANLSNQTEDGCIREDIPLAVSYLEKACKLGSGFSCYMLAGVYISGAPGVVERDVSAALKYDFEACKLNFPLACANLNGALASGSPSSGALWRAAHIKSFYGAEYPK